MHNNIKHSTRLKRNIYIVILMTAAALTAFIFIGLLDNALSATVYEIVSAEIPEALDGFKIAHISDFHSGLFSGTAADVIRLTAGQKPDIICLTGDNVDGTTKDLESVATLVAGLMRIAPVYAVSGNNEFYDETLIGRIKEVYKECGVRFIDGEKVTIYNNGALITLLGIADPGNGDSGFHLKSLPVKNSDEGYGIILYHRANEFDDLIHLDYNLVLSGHLHGGLLRIPAAGGVLSPDGILFPKYSGGLYESGGVYLVSNRGIGNNHPIPRIYNPPEVAVIVLRSGDQGE